jgi:hypothetical protein
MAKRNAGKNAPVCCSPTAVSAPNSGATKLPTSEMCPMIDRLIRPGQHRPHPEASRRGGNENRAAQADVEQKEPPPAGRNGILEDVSHRDRMLLGHGKLDVRAVQVGNSAGAELFPLR